MKILFIAHRIPWPLKDGGSIAIYNNLKGFVDAGCQVKFLATKPLKDATDVKGLPNIFRQTETEYVSIDTGIKAIPALLNLFGNKSYNAERFYNSEFAVKIVQALKHGNFDLVHIEGAFAGQYIEVIKKVKNIPCVLREHNVEHVIWQRMASQESHPLRSWYMGILASRLQTYEENLWKKFDLITTVTGEDANQIASVAGNHKVFNGGVGFNLEAYITNNIPVKENTLFHLASMDWLPNQEAVGWLLNKLWPEIKKQTQGFRLFIAGKKMPAQFLVQKGENLEIEAEVPDAVEYMADKEIMLVPLLSGSGIRIKSIEAMAMGKVIISTSLGHSGLGITPGKEMLEANTTNEFVEQLKYLQANPGRKGEIATEARQFALEHFDNKKVMERLLNRYSKLIQLA